MALDAAFQGYDEEDLQKGLGIAGPEVAAGKSKLDPGAFLGMIDRVGFSVGSSGQQMTAGDILVLLSQLNAAGKTGSASSANCPTTWTVFKNLPSASKNILGVPNNRS